MSGLGEDEKRGLTNSFRSQFGYGTATVSSATKKSTPKTRRFISRTVQRTDTLMGIALKYGTTVQDLKKENKLWNVDHLFLRETLLIPLTEDNQDAMDHNDSLVVYDGRSLSLSSSSGNLESCREEETHSSSSSFTNGGSSSSSRPSSSYTAAVLDIQPHRHYSTQSSSLASKNPVNVSDGGDSATASTPSDVTSAATTGDFFSKYDNSIAKLKGDVARLENNATHLDGLIETNPLSLPTRKGSTSSSTGGSNSRAVRYVNNRDGNSSPVLLIRSRTNSRRVASMREDNFQADDDFFEL